MSQFFRLEHHKTYLTINRTCAVISLITLLATLYSSVTMTAKNTYNIHLIEGGHFFLVLSAICVAISMVTTSKYAIQRNRLGCTKEEIGEQAVSIPFTISFILFFITLFSIILLGSIQITGLQIG